MKHQDDTNKDLNGCAGCSSENLAGIGRRSFIGALLGTGSLLIGAIVGGPVFRFVFYPVYAKSKSDNWSDVGDIADFEKIDTPIVKTVEFAERDGWREVVTAQSVYVGRAATGELQVLSAICPHMGCSVAWQAGQGKFVCPCHGGQFGADGKHIAGPPPRSLDNLKSQVSNGRLQVQFEFFRCNVPNRELMS
jgi:menaquinol-cytochrome c reductase iron-sulfur subunit